MTAPNIAFFPAGGFVAHGLMIGSSRYSAWYDADGTLKDAERVTPRAAFPVKRGGPAWQHLAARGMALNASFRIPTKG